MLKRLFILILMAGAIVAAVAYTHRHKPAVEKMENNSKAAAVSAKGVMTDAVATGKEMAGEVAANVTAATKTGVKKAGQTATNVAGKTKVMASNVASKVAHATTNIVEQAKKGFQKILH